MRTGGMVEGDQSIHTLDGKNFLFSECLLHCICISSYPLAI
jgi:hypothetical protein